MTTKSTLKSSSVTYVLERCVKTLKRSIPLFLVLCISAGFFAWIWQEALTDPRFQLDGQAIAIALSDPAHFPEAESSLLLAGNKLAGQSLLNPDLLPNVRKCLGESPWIQTVDQVRRSPPDQVELSFVVRTPVAQIHYDGYFWLVDKNKILLPVKGRKNPVPDFPQIYGDIESRPDVGAVWNEPAVNDSFALLAELSQHGLDDVLSIAAVQVQLGSFLDRLAQTRRTRPRLEIKTTTQLSIRWGTFAYHSVPDEIDTSEKIVMLKSLLARKPQSGSILDIRTRVPGIVAPQAQNTEIMLYRPYSPNN